MVRGSKMTELERRAAACTGNRVRFYMKNLNVNPRN